MTVDTAIRAHLLTLSAVTALVGQRVYTSEWPQSNKQSGVLVRLIDEVQTAHLRGGVSLFRARVQVDAVAFKASGVDHKAVATAIDEAVHGPGDGSGLCGFHGDVGSPAFEIEAILPDSVREIYSPDVLQMFVRSRDYFVTHRG